MYSFEVSFWRAVLALAAQQSNAKFFLKTVCVQAAAYANICVAAVLKEIRQLLAHTAPAHLLAILRQLQR